MNAAETLNAAADLLDRPGAWTQGGYAKSSEGHEVCIDSANATCWCAYGALVVASNDRLIDTDVTTPLCRVIGTTSIPRWNDTPGRTQAEVVAAFRKAAELAREDAA